jgi:hypothetical protein
VYYFGSSRGASVGEVPVELGVVAGGVVVTGTLVVVAGFSVLAVDADSDVVVVSLVLVHAANATAKTANDANDLIWEMT